MLNLYHYHSNPEQLIRESDEVMYQNHLNDKQLFSQLSNLYSELEEIAKWYDDNYGLFVKVETHSDFGSGDSYEWSMSVEYRNGAEKSFDDIEISIDYDRHSSIFKMSANDKVTTYRTIKSLVSAIYYLIPEPDM